MTICAAPGCMAEFTKRPGARHQIYCSRRCRNHMAKVATAAREAMVPKSAKRLRMEAERLGGTVQGGAMLRRAGRDDLLEDLGDAA